MHTTSTLLWEPTAFHVTPGELGNQLGPNKAPWVSPHTDKAEPATAALYIFKDEGKTPTV